VGHLTPCRVAQAPTKLWHAALNEQNGVWTAGAGAIGQPGVGHPAVWQTSVHPPHSGTSVPAPVTEILRRRDPLRRRACCLWTSGGRMRSASKLCRACIPAKPAVRSIGACNGWGCDLWAVRGSVRPAYHEGRACAPTKPAMRCVGANQRRNGLRRWGRHRLFLDRSRPRPRGARQRIRARSPSPCVSLGHHHQFE
jgi:hypothetical protein